MPLGAPPPGRPRFISQQSGAPVLRDRPRPPDPINRLLAAKWSNTVVHFPCSARKFAWESREVLPEPSNGVGAILCFVRNTELQPPTACAIQDQSSNMGMDRVSKWSYTVVPWP